MHLKSVLPIVCLGLVLLGGSQLSGKHYLESEQYEEGIRVFKKMLHDNPKDPEVDYYLGRFYLAQEKPEEALSFLHRATELKSEAEYYFWLGVAYWGVMDFKEERLSYQRALALNKDHVPARLYLGHNLLDGGAWEAALTEYDRVLKLDPSNPEALYNRGLALKELKRPAEEKTAWKIYLHAYPSGKWALRAGDHLNALGDFSYRNFTVGYRRVLLESISFVSGSAMLLSQGETSLQALGTILRINREIELEIVGYKIRDGSLATARAKAVKDYLLGKFPAINARRLTYRGEGHAEEIEIGGRIYRLDESIRFNTTKK